MNISRTVTFILTNRNPINIKLKTFTSTLSNADIQLDYMKPLNGNKTKIFIKNFYKNNNISQVRAFR